MYIGQAEVSASVAVGEAFVVDTEEMEDGGVEIVDGDSVFDGPESEVIGGSVNGAAFDTATGHP